MLLPCRVFTPPASPGSRLARRAPCSTPSSSWRRASRRAALIVWPTVRWCRPRWGAPKPSWRPDDQGRAATCAYLFETLASIYAGADAIEPIAVADRARVRLAAVNAIHAAVDVAYVCYRAAGVDAIFVGSPYERRFRDIHTLSQQIQSRAAHFEAVGQILLGQPPELFF